MLNLLKLLPALALIFSWTVLPARFPSTTALRPWTNVGADAYLQIANNTKLDLPIFVAAPEVDSTVRFLGSVGKCSTQRFKLPYVEAHLVVIAADARFPLDVDKPKTYTLELRTDNPALQCPSMRKIAFRVIEFVDPPRWRSSPWFRISDVETPAKIVIAGDATACLIWQIDTEPIRQGDLYTCKTDWRMPTTH